MSALHFIRAVTFDNYKLVYYPIPKVANTAIAYYFGKLDGIEYQGVVEGGEGAGDIPKKIQYSPNPPANWFSFTFVRNPYSRLVSCWWDKCRNAHKGRANIGIDPGCSFEEFIEFVCQTPDIEANHHFRSQYTFFPVNPLSFTGKLETITDDWARIAGRVKKINPEAPSHLPRINSTTQQRPATEIFYSDNLKEMVFARYREDFKRLKYEP